MLELAVSSLTHEGFQNTQYEDLFANAFYDGYRNVEFNCWYAESITSQRIQYLKKQCRRTGLKPIALHVSGFGGEDEEILSLNTGHKLRAIEAAAELGCNMVVASVMERCRSLDEIVRQLINLEKASCDAGVQICLENHCHNRLAIGNDFQYIFDRFGSPFVGICLDGGHLEAAGEQIDSFINRFFPKIYHLHYKENQIFGKKSFCKFGEGTTKNEYMICEMEKKGYSGYISVELSPEIGGKERNISFSRVDRVKPLQYFASMEKKKL